MKQQFLVKRGASETLLLFFGGWGSDASIFRGLRGPNPAYFGVIEGQDNCDVMLCYDYTSLDFDPQQIAGYRQIFVEGWSMGVWVAGVVLERFPEVAEMVKRSVAINGTLTPVCDSGGIAVDIFRGTHENFSAVTLSRFRRRMCGGADGVRDFLALEPSRSVESLGDELRALDSHIQQLETPVFTWDLAIIGTEDKIFLPQNQERGWEGRAREIRQVAGEHFCISLF